MTHLIRCFLISLVLILAGCATKEPVSDDVTDSIEITLPSGTLDEPIDEFALNPEFSEVDEDEALDKILDQDIKTTVRPIPHKEMRAIRDVTGVVTSDAMLNSMENQSVWQVLEQNFDFLDYENELIDQYYNALNKHKSSVLRIEQRAKYYMPAIAKAVIDAGLPGEIALLPIVESNLKPKARSHAGAGGMWQFMPATGKRFGLTRDSWWDARYDIELSTQSAIEYLTYLSERFDGDWLLALAAYNCGEARVRKEIKKNIAQGKGTQIFDLTGLPRETRNYVPKLLAIKKLVENNFILVTEPSNPRYIAFSPTYFSIDIDRPTELSVIAAEAGISVEDLELLNSAILKGVTPPGRTVALHLPKNVSRNTAKKIAALPQSERVSWQSYTVRKGDTLGKIANQYSIPTSALRETNSLKGSLIRIGQQLVIPAAVRNNTTAATSIAEDVQSKKKNERYQVKYGDTLWTIARNYNISIKQLTQANEISSKETLQPGQYLTIP